MRRFHTAACLLALAIVAPQTGHANDRYATPPPIVLSPDLTQPWVMQLQNRNGQAHSVSSNGRRVVVRRESQPLRQVAPQRASQPRQQTAQLTPANPAPRPTSRGIDPMYLPQMVAYNGSAAPGTIVISTRDKFLYLVMEGGQAKRYGVGVGREGFSWKGTETITRKAEWPSWRPPASMIKRVREQEGRILPAYMPGGPDNPMGARALYLGSTLYRIHGTNQPWTIGQAMSSGCIRMRNEDVEDLYTRVGVGTKVVVL